MALTAADIALHLQGQVQGDASVPLTGLAPADSVKPGDLTFAENEIYFARAEASAASAILVAGDFTSSKKVLIRVPNARAALAKILPLFFPAPSFAAGIHATAVIAASAQIDPTAHIGPHCVIGENVRIGARSVLQSGNHLGGDCQLGEDIHLFPNVTIYPRSQIGDRVRIHAGAVIGADGFGYVFAEDAHRKIPQVGHVVIHNDVEIGANTTIDRGALGSTIIGKGTKIDNLVQIGHNVVIGEHCILCSMVGISGSTRIGNYVTLAGQVGLADHLKIGNQVTIGGQSGVMHNIPDGEKWLGTPAQTDRCMKRQYIAIQQLPELRRRIGELEKRLAEALEKKAS